MRLPWAYTGWQGGRLRQEEAARLLGVCARTFRRYVDRYEEEGLEGRIDKRLDSSRSQGRGRRWMRSWPWWSATGGGTWGGT